MGTQRMSKRKSCGDGKSLVYNSAIVIRCTYLTLMRSNLRDYVLNIATPFVLNFGYVMSVL